VFKAFVEEQVLLYCLQYLGPQSVLILDNVCIHKLEQLYKLYRQYSVELRFLLLYLLDFNPIEAFKDIKA